ncbi:MAG: class I SAM-dependent methyltransferase [Sulfurimicrobium sp.]|jgi:SAM-dependent methyltransferase|nr:class I SAM-dependent methyltransferase [Sulfurimicrobium sp.]MDO9190609.1 class I SAM-dependent methyltransferase [Sulfurimicrobium sp.]MDP1897735.1 class I SAM-dependent methyltransferase [Sulfurimicrobium sp.]MDP2197621.1 class I SAM-dependent methyltransferase [Sulfurimicrobium sp.]MDP2963024.1 class I SAM-dependent methyltransferase [Sulfurimicrobium sp.]
MPDSKTHWEQVYSSRKPHEVGWYQAYPEIPLHLIASTGANKTAAIIDVGGGASNLVDALLENGYCDVTVLDLSAAALKATQARLGEASNQVKWLVADITSFTPPRQYDVWHDRAVFHFLTEAADRQRYVEAARAALPPGGHLIMATFALDGPPQCSGLDVVRYSPESLRQAVGEGFALAESFGGLHITPSQGKQSYTFCRFIRN